MKGKLVNTISRTFHKTGLVLKKHSPELFLVGGLVAGAGCVVTACKATLKVDEVLDETKEKVEKVHEAVENGVTQAGVVYTVEDSKKDLAIVYVQTGIKMVKLYAPSIILGTLSVASILTSHNVLKKRNLALAAAYTTLDNTFKDYRGRVVERFGDRIDQELRYNIKAKEIEEVSIDENGNEVKTTRTVETADLGVKGCSMYARFFDELSSYYEKDAEYNLMFLRRMEDTANDLFESRGHLFVNEVYDMLDIPRSRAGQTDGWIWKKGAPLTDNRISFGLDNVHNQSVRQFVNGHERAVLLDFPNVETNILDKVGFGSGNKYRDFFDFGPWK